VKGDIALVGPYTYISLHMSSQHRLSRSDDGFLYTLSIVTMALLLTIRPQFAIECLRRSIQQGVGHFGTKFGEEGLTMQAKF